MNAGMKPKSPDEEVAIRIVEAMSQAQLMPAESIAKLQVLLLEGTMTAEEWKFFLEPLDLKSGHNG
jgi:hypothetical protein